MCGIGKQQIYSTTPFLFLFFSFLFFFFQQLKSLRDSNAPSITCIIHFSNLFKRGKSTHRCKPSREDLGGYILQGVLCLV